MRTKVSSKGSTTTADENGERKIKAQNSRKAVTSTSSWTGKLPASLLHEHCQRMKWERVEYEYKRQNGGFIATVVLAQKDLKSQSVEKLKFIPPSGLVPPKESQMEARHLAATYTLFRIASDKNLKMVLPGEHRDLWSKLDEEKKSGTTRPEIYASDPFSSKKITKHGASGTKRADDKLNIKAQTIRTLRTADQRPIVYRNQLSMERAMRTSIESVVRDWGGSHLIASVRSSIPREKIVVGLLDVGFRESEASEAARWAENLPGAVEWLLLHLPEDDLPKIFQKSKSLANGLTLQSSDLKFEYAVRSIARFGYNEDLVRDTLKIKCGNPSDALSFLNCQFLDESDIVVESEHLNHEGETLWAEECEAISALYDSKCDSDTCEIILDSYKLHLWRPQNYPEIAPGIGITCSDQTYPKYKLLEVVQRAIPELQYLRGSSFLLSTIQWMEDNFLKVVSESSQLLTISTALTGRQLKYVATVPARSSKPKRKGHVHPDLVKKIRESYGTSKFCEMHAKRKLLPAWEKKEQIIHEIANNQVTIITGETGSGKSTQVVQYILDSYIERGECPLIVCTQPRRIAAIGLAQRVADERDSQLGDVVGYVIRGESKQSKNTLVKFATAGVLLKMLQGDLNDMSHMTHIFVDEVHERSLDISFLLIILRRLISKSNIKIVLMSATANVDGLRKYFASHASVGSAHIPGRTFPVQDIYLEDIIRTLKYIPESIRGDASETDVGRIILTMRGMIDFNLVQQLLEHIDTVMDQGSILIFMSGAAEIDLCIKSIQSHRFEVLPLHSSLHPQQQRLIFSPPAAHRRRVVVSTNIAETSITIPDVVAVVDSGRVKHMCFDSDAAYVRLEDRFASQAELKQRKGRAGRVKAGQCFKLFSKKFESELDEFPIPEIQRAPLEQIVLSVAAMGVSSIESFLAEAIEPPMSMAVAVAKDALCAMGCLNPNGSLTPLGKHVSMVPTDVKTAKLVIFASLFGVLEQGLTCAAILAVRSPFTSARDKQSDVKEYLTQNGSELGDIISVSKVYAQWKYQNDTFGASASRKWCSHRHLSSQVMIEIRSAIRQFREAITETGFEKRKPQHPERFPNDDSGINREQLVSAVITAALYPNAAELVLPSKQYKEVSGGSILQDPDENSIKYYTKLGRVYVHPSSLLYHQMPTRSSWHISFASKIMTNRLFIRNCTRSTIFAVLFFSNGINVDILGSGITIDGWIGIKCWPRIGILIKLLKKLFDRVLEAKLADPELNLQENEIMAIVVRLLEADS